MKEEKGHVAGIQDDRTAMFEAGLRGQQDEGAVNV